METLLSVSASDPLRQIFTDRELMECGHGPDRLKNAAGRFAAKEACRKLFPGESALGVITAIDFEIRLNATGSGRMEPSVAARTVLDRHRIADIRVSVTQRGTTFSATATADSKQTEVPWFGKLIYYILPWRRGIVLANLGRVFGDVLPEDEIRRIAQAYYAHIARSFMDFVRLRLMSPERKKQWVRSRPFVRTIRAADCCS